jgi:adenosylhomocysteine nucleosidase
MKIGIMGAMPEEVSSISELMHDVREVQHAGRRFLEGTIQGVEVVLTFSYCGKVASAITAASLILFFKVEQLIFTGLAGAIADSLNIGDLVISERLYQHDMDARPLFPKYEIPLTGMSSFYSDKNLVKEVTSASEMVFIDLKKEIPKETWERFGIVSPKTLLGSIASGDQFISCEKQAKEILSEQSDTLAVEMEGAAVAQVCHDYSVPFVIVRTISDTANHSAHIDFASFLNELAKHYSKSLISHLFSRF